jgi:hypothetical protein
LSKNVVDIFTQLLAKYVLNLNVSEREQLLETYYNVTIKTEESNRHPSGEISITLIDIKNGYMKISANYGDAGLEICYWNREKTEKLIAINHYGYATSKFTIAISFLLYQDKSDFTELQSTEIIPYADISKHLNKNKMTSDEQKLARQLELYKQENIVLELPRFGKRIKATYGIDNSDNWRTRLLEHDSVELGWDQLNLVIQK